MTIRVVARWFLEVSFEFVFLTTVISEVGAVIVDAQRCNLAGLVPQFRHPGVQFWHPRGHGRVRGHLGVRSPTRIDFSAFRDFLSIAVLAYWLKMLFAIHACFQIFSTISVQNLVVRILKHQHLLLEHVQLFLSQMSGFF